VDALFLIGLLYIYVNQNRIKMSDTIKFKKSKKDFTIDYVKANKKRSRDEELEGMSGFTSTHKIFKSKKHYSKKQRKFMKDFLADE
jgi:hypothetical protein